MREKEEEEESNRMDAKSQLAHSHVGFCIVKVASAVMFGSCFTEPGETGRMLSKFQIVHAQGDSSHRLLAQTTYTTLK